MNHFRRLCPAFRQTRLHRRASAIAAVVCLALGSSAGGRAQQAPAASEDDHALVQQLLERVKELEAQVQQLKAAPAATQGTPGRPAPEAESARAPTAEPEANATPPGAPLPQASRGAQTESQTTAQSSEEVQAEDVSAGHTMQIPGGGPELKIRGFLDFNLGLGTDANPLIYPLNIPPGRCIIPFNLASSICS